MAPRGRKTVSTVFGEVPPGVAGDSNFHVSNGKQIQRGLMENKSRGINVRCLWVKYKRTNPEEKQKRTNPEETD